MGERRTLVAGGNVMEIRAVQSEVTSVTVYARGARVLRRAVLERDGESFPDSVALSGLPLSLHDDSVKVSLVAAGNGAAPSARDVRVTLDVPERDETLLPVTPERLEEARLEETRLEARGQQLARELARVRGLELLERPAGAEGEPPQASPTDARLALIEFRESQSRSLASALEDTEQDRVKAHRARLELEAQNRIATSARQAEEHELRKAVVVALSGRDADAESVVLEVEYQVPGARWAPAYALQLDRGMTRATLSMRAVVAQHCGEDWAGVGLTLCTAEMQRFTELPELSSLRIGRVQAEPPKAGWRPAPTGAEELYSDWDRSFREHFYDRSTPKPKSQTAPLPAAAPPEPAVEIAEPDYAASATMSFAAKEAELLDDVAFGGEAFDEPPMAGAMPMPQAPLASPAAAPMTHRKGGMLSGLLSRGAAPAPARRSMRKKSVAPGSTTGAQVANHAIAPAGEPEVGAALLRYGDLRMSAPGDRRRGSLVLASRQEIYLQLLVSQEVSVAVDVLGAIARADSRAETIADDRLPRGCKLAWSEHYDYAYRARAQVDLPSDGSFHSVPLAEADAEVERLYVVVPRESTDVFRTVSLENPLDAPLLAGPIDVYLGGDFLLTSQVDATAARGKLALGLGVEQGIKVARNIHYREETAGLIGGSLELHHKLLIDVNNNLDRAVPLEVRERIPAVREDDEDEIKVSTDKVTPPWERYEPEPESPREGKLEGGYRWLLQVPAGGSEKLRAEYEIKISSKHELVGGNRREV